MGNSETLRASIGAMLDYLKVEESNQLRLSLKKASPEQLPKMFYEMTSAIADIMGDKTILNTIQVRLPNGKVVSYEEAEKEAAKSGFKKTTMQPQKANTVENVQPDPVEYVNADQPFSYRPSGRAKSKRSR